MPIATATDKTATTITTITHIPGTMTAHTDPRDLRSGPLRALLPSAAIGFVLIIVLFVVGVSNDISFWGLLAVWG